MSEHPSETRPHKKDEFKFYTYPKLTELFCGLQQVYHRSARAFSPVEFRVLYEKVILLQQQYDKVKKGNPNPARQSQAAAIVTFAQRMQQADNPQDREKANERNAILGFLLFRLMRFHRNSLTPEAKKATSTYMGGFFRVAAQVMVGGVVDSELERLIHEILRNSNVKELVPERMIFDCMDEYSKWLYLESFQRVLKEEEKNNSARLYIPDLEEKKVLSDLIAELSQKDSVMQERRCIQAIIFLQTLNQECIRPFKKLFEETGPVTEAKCKSLLAGEHAEEESALKNYHEGRCLALFKGFPGGNFQEIKLWVWFSKLTVDKQGELLNFMRRGHQERCLTLSLGLMLTLFYGLEEALPTKIYLLDETRHKNPKFVAAMKELFCPQGLYCLEPENALHLRGALDVLDKYMQARKQDKLPIDEALFKGSYEAIFETIQKVRNAVDKFSIASEPLHRAAPILTSF